MRDCSAIPAGAEILRQAHTHPLDAPRDVFDVLVIGAGPSGVSCAVWLARLGFAPMLIEAASDIGGLCLSHAYLDGWNASLPGHTGVQIAANLTASVQQAAIPVRLSCPVTRIGRRNGVFHAQSSALAQPLRARYLVLATGVRARGLPEGPESAPGLLIGPGGHVLAQHFHGKTLAVLGGGDNAFENALQAMRQGAARVDVYVRGIRAQRQFVRRIPAARLIHTDNVCVSRTPLAVNRQPYDFVLVCYGWDPCVPALDGLVLRRDARGFLHTDPRTAQTSEAGLYAIGEVARRQHPCVVTAMADGVVAAKAIQARLEARRTR